jgi:type I restriction enzyme S subunit
MSVSLDVLPEGWVSTTLGEVSPWQVPQSGPAPGTVFTYIDISSVDNIRKLVTETKQLSAEKAPSRARQRVSSGDILVSMTRPNLNAVAKVPLELDGSIASTGFHVLRGVEVEPDWLLAVVRSCPFVRQMSELVQGALYPAVRPVDIRSFEFPLPPLAEQRRILAKIEALQAHSRKAREVLEAIPPLLEQNRQSVLAAAFRGDLTADWREQYPHGEPASVLLDRIRQERRRLWEAMSPRKKYVEPEPVDDPGLPELPEGWAYARADELVAPGTVISYGIVLPGEPLSEGVSYVRGQDIEDGQILVDQLWKTSPEIAAKHERSSLREGDVLLCIIRHLKVAVVPMGMDGANLTQGTVRMRPSNVITAPYLARYLESPIAQGWMKGRYFGMAMPRINVEDARAIPVPVAPPAEQRKIAFRLEKYEGHRRCVLAEVRQAVEELDRLDQAILAKAFRGELVEQDPADEPASALLERIRADRESGNGSTRKGRRSRT